MSNQLIKLAKLAHAGASIKTMTSIFNVDQEQIMQLIETKEYAKALSEVVEEDFERSQLLDKGWDGVEEIALSNVVNALRHNPDPDFALKAASLANKAIKRTGAQNKANNPIMVNQNLQAVIQINPQFAKTLQDNYLIEDVKEVKLQKKVTNALNPSAVKKLLAPLTSMADIAENLLDDIGMENLV